MSRNFLGGFFKPGKPLPVFVREEIVDLYNNGVGVSEISRNTRVTKGAFKKSCNTLPSTARRPGGGVLPYMGRIGMCGPKGYGFSAVSVINRESILADFGHFGH